MGDNWVSPVYRRYTSICCDCGLTHTIDFRIYKGQIQFRARRNNKSTANVRRKKQEIERVILKKMFLNKKNSMKNLKKHSKEINEIREIINKLWRIR